MKIKAKMAKESKWKNLYIIERNIVRIFVGGLLLYFIAQVFIAFVYTFFAGEGFSIDSVGLFLEEIRKIWLYHIGGFFAVLDAIMFILAFVFFYKGWPYRPQLKVYPPPSDLGQKLPKNPRMDPETFIHWKQIVEKANTGNQENMKSAIIEADALLAQHLDKKGFTGDTVAERLKKLNYKAFKTLKPLWRAHRLRNEIAHTPNIKITAKQAQTALLQYRNFFKETRAF